MPIDIIVSVVLVVIIGAAIAYIVRSKKRGDACIGCPYAKQCGGKCNGGCGSQQPDEKDKSQPSH